MRRVLCSFLSAQKGGKKTSIRLREYPIINTDNFIARHIIHIILHQYNRCESFIRVQTKPPQSCEERKPAPPNEEQFNAPTTGGHVMKERIK